MLTGAEIKSGRDLDRSIENRNLEIWTCGCTVVGSVAPINMRCISCGNVLKKMSKRNKVSAHKQGKIENAKIELVNNIQTLFTETGEAIPCQRCDNSGEVKVFTQEWDRIKSHSAPCPVCRSQEWLDWSAGKRILKEKK